jgi:hypothetical protein
MMPEWLKKHQAGLYSSVSERTVHEWLKSGLRHSRLPSGTILIKRSWLDDFLLKFEATGNQVDDVVNDVCRGLEI